MDEEALTTANHIVGDEKMSPIQTISFEFDPHLEASSSVMQSSDTLFEAPEPFTFVNESISQGSADDSTLHRVIGNIARDHQNYYSVQNLAYLGVGTGIASGLANSNADEFVSHDWYQESIRNASTDDYFNSISEMKVFGEGVYALPIYFAALAGGWIPDDTGTLSTASVWGEKSLRAVLVGTPPMLAMQRLTGASRPTESSSQSHWEPFQDENGVSGHAFMGAIPFITAAKMTDNDLLRAALYVGSGMAGLSRLNDDRHYLSQVSLGWWMAYLAANSVDRTESTGGLHPVVQLTPDGFTGLSFERLW